MNRKTRLELASKYKLYFILLDKTTQRVVIWEDKTYCQTSNISGFLICNKTVDHSDVVGAPPVGAAPTTSSFST